ncbi:Hypothetical protein PBC10988_36160 [Planctomycetales bacterium 10988]|nr:Hypothetical protein PBC10988_36160 [Planctomycetales bacterium 10988]
MNIPLNKVFAMLRQLSVHEAPSFGNLSLFLLACAFPSLLMAQGGRAPVQVAQAGSDLDEAAIFVTDRPTMRLMSRAEENLEEKRWGEAVERLGQVLDGPEDYFYQPDRFLNSFLSLKARALELIGEMPEEGRETYQRHYGPIAQNLLEEAVALGDINQLAEVARRFFHTEAGYEATHRLGMIHLDHMRPLAAALCFKRLLAIPQASEKYEPQLSILTALCFVRVGSDEALDEARKTLQEARIQYNSKPLSFLGERASWFASYADPLDWLAANLGTQLQDTGTSREEWVMHRGNPARNATTEGGIPLLSYNWRVPVSNDKPTVEQYVEEFQSDLLGRNVGLLPGLYPLVVKLDLQEASLLREDSVRHWGRFVESLKDENPVGISTPQKRIWSFLSGSLQDQLTEVSQDSMPPAEVRQRLVEELNAIMTRGDFYEATAWQGVPSRKEAEDLLKKGIGNLSKDAIFRMNRVWLEAAFDSLISMSYANVVLVRSYNNLLAIDFVTGKRVWEVPVSEADDPLERILYGAKSGQGDEVVAQAAKGVGHRLFHDTTFGTLASDGTHVFSIEDLPLPLQEERGRSFQPMLVIGNKSQTTTGPVDFNRLVAYDIRTGKLRWEVGGPKGVEGELTQAGMFFLGPPLPLSGRLYCIAEVSREVRLIVLDADTGQQEWSQTLALVETSILEDPTRAASGVSPSYANGVLVCPTASGAVVAVDLSNRSLLWGYRYESDDRRSGRRIPSQSTSLSSNELEDFDRWSDSLPTVIRDSILLTPVESNELHCLSLVDGQVLWKASRDWEYEHHSTESYDSGLYVAGVEGDKILIVGTHGMVARSMKDGDPLWEMQWPDAGSAPSGRGFLSGTDYYVPMTDGKVLQVDAITGKVKAKATSRDQLIPGNLVCFDGSILSQGVDFVYCFNELAKLDDDITQALANNPKDSEALRRRGEIFLQREQTKEAVEYFEKALEQRESPYTRELLVEALLEEIKTDFATNQNRVPEIERHLAALPVTSQRHLRLKFLRVLALGQEEIGELDAAFKTWLSFVDPEAELQELEMVEQDWSVRPDCMFQGKVAELYHRASSAQRSGIELVIQERFQEALSAGDSLAALDQFLDRFGSIASADLARQKLADLHETEGNYLQAEQLWLSLMESPDRVRAAEATARMLSLLMNSRFFNEKRISEVMYFMDLLENEYREVPCWEGKTGAEFAKLRKQEIASLNVLTNYAWPNGNVESDVESRNAQGWRYYPVQPLGRVSPFFHNGGIVLDQTQRRFIGRNRLGEAMWEVSLRNEDDHGGNFIGLNPYANRFRSNGHLVMLWTGLNIFAIDTLNPDSQGRANIIWQKNMNEGLPGLGRNQGVRIHIVVRNGQRQTRVTDHLNQPLPPVGPISQDYVCFHRRRDLVAVDPYTGEELWIRHQVDPGSEIFGDAEYIFVAPEQNDRDTTEVTATVYRALDGQFLKNVTIPSVHQRLAVFGRYVLGWTEKNGKKVLWKQDVWEDRTLWEEAFDTDSLIDSIEEDQLVVYEPDSSKVTIVNVSDGELLAQQEVDTSETQEDVQELFLLRSADRFLVLAGEGRMADDTIRAVYAVNGGMDNPNFHGNIYAFDRKSGELAWQKRITHQAIPLRQPEDLPVLIFACRLQVIKQSTPQGRASYSNEYEVLCLNKEDGRIVYSRRSNESISGFEAEADLQEREVTIKMLRSTVKLKYTNDPIPEPSEPAAVAEDANKEEEEVEPED